MTLADGSDAFAIRSGPPPLGEANAHFRQSAPDPQSV
jgi:hypothetical protein